MTPKSLKRGIEIQKEIEELKWHLKNLPLSIPLASVDFRFKESRPVTFSIREIPEAQPFVESVIARMKDDIRKLETEFENL